MRHKLLPFTNPSLRPAGKHAITRRQQYRLEEPLKFELTLLNGDEQRHGGIDILVPVGFVTDFASVPRCLWSIFPPQDDYSRAAILHDYLYCIKVCSRFLADALFREAMRLLNVPRWKRVVMYYAVRFGGRSAWKRAKL